MTQSILNALLGGGLIGLAATGMMLSVGRIAGISGVVGGLLKPTQGDLTWRLAFLGGLLAGGVVLAFTMPQVFASPTGRSLQAVALAGLLVGLGTRMGNGCTSGHGVCGITRLSPRSVVATLTFMTTGALVATGVGMLQGGV
jgi:uncharacterized membrane protein YedE/YeeE